MLTRFFRDPALRCYGLLGDVDQVVTLFSEDLADGFHAQESLRYDPAFASIRNDPRIQKLIDQQEAWANAQPDPIDL